MSYVQEMAEHGPRGGYASRIEEKHHHHHGGDNSGMGLGAAAVAIGGIVIGGLAGYALSRNNHRGEWCGGGWGGFPGGWNFPVAGAVANREFPVITGAGCCPPAAEQTVNNGRLENVGNFKDQGQNILISAQGIVDRVTTALDTRQVQVANAFERLTALQVALADRLQASTCAIEKTVEAAADLIVTKISCTDKMIAEQTCQITALQNSVCQVKQEVAALPCVIAKNNELAALVAENAHLKERLWGCERHREESRVLSELAIINSKLPTPAAPALGTPASYNPQVV